MASSSGRKRSRPQTVESTSASPSQPAVRPILVEREIILGDFRDLTWEGRSIHDIITDRGWTPICRQRGTAYPEMVGEFYRAMGEQPGDALCYNLVVRGVSIIFSPRVIAEFLDLRREPGAYPATAATRAAARSTTAPSGEDTTVASSSPLPDVQTAELDASSDDSESGDEVPDDGLTDDQVRDLVRDPEAPPYDGSKVIRQADCIAFFRMLNLIVGYNIDPKKHKTDFRIERARFLLRLAQGEPIDLALYFFLRIRTESRYSGGGSLPFALLISNLLLHSGVTVTLTERRSPQMGPVNKITFSKSKGHLSKTRPVLQDQPPPTDPASTAAAPIERHPAGATPDEVRAILADHRDILLRDFIQPMMEKLKDLEGRLQTLQEDFDLYNK